MKRTVHVYVGRCSTSFDIGEDETDEEIEEMARQTSLEYFDWRYEVICPKNKK